MVELKFLKLDEAVIIATKGLPCTGKSEIARMIAQWARSPVFYIDHFLDAFSLEKDYTAESLPSPDEAERLHRLSFDALCSAASNTLQWGLENLSWNCKSVVVKSRLCSTFEVDRLLQLAKERGCGMILIIEFRMKNEYRYLERLKHKVKLGGQKKWYKPRSWNDDIEKTMDDYEADNWDLHLHNLLYNGDGLPRVTRLVLDPFDDLFLFPFTAVPNMALEIINHLLEMDERVQHGELVVQYGKVGRYLRWKKLSCPRSTDSCGNRHKYLCYACKEGCVCLLNYWEKLEAEVDDEGNPYYCGVCEELVILGQPAYACNFCTLTLHQSCAETTTSVDFTIEGFEDIDSLRFYSRHLPRGRHSCNSCLEGGKGFTLGCKSCDYQTHLKCRVLPTILNHDCHECFLTIHFYYAYKCNACGSDRHRLGGLYGCYICFMHYDIECLSLVREPEHEHGGHQHTPKLIYSRDGMDKEEAYWCEICYEDIDPQNWFYSCQDCPSFEAHPNCVRLSS